MSDRADEPDSQPAYREAERVAEARPVHATPARVSGKVLAQQFREWAAQLSQKMAMKK